MASLICLGTFASTAAQAAPTESTVRSIEVKSAVSTLILNLDKPMPAVEATAAKQRLQRQMADQAVSAAVSDIMFCTTERWYYDSNGALHLARNCQYRQLRWDYRISAGVRAIIVSLVNETGLWYWINGVRQPRNSPHLVPKDYLFHGTMSGVDTGENVDYQDYMTFRHNVGPGGTGSLTFAGSVAMR